MDDPIEQLRLQLLHMQDQIAAAHADLEGVRIVLAKGTAVGSLAEIGIACDWLMTAQRRRLTEYVRLWLVWHNLSGLEPSSEFAELAVGLGLDPRLYRPSSSN